MKINDINGILVNKSKIKLCVGIIVGIAILTGCKINNNIPESVSVESQQKSKYSNIEINFSNRDILTENDNIVLVDEKGYILNYVKSDRDIWNIEIKNEEDGIWVCSSVLNQKKQLPKVCNNEKYIINIDYDKKTLIIKTEE